MNIIQNESLIAVLNVKNKIGFNQVPYYTFFYLVGDVIEESLV